MTLRSGLYIVPTNRWYIERTVWLIAGLILLVATALATFVHPLWVFGAIALALFSINVSLTGFCVVGNALRLLGLRQLLDTEDQLASRLAESRAEAQRILEDAREETRRIEDAAREQRRARLDAMNSIRESALEVVIIGSRRWGRQRHSESTMRERSRPSEDFPMRNQCLCLPNGGFSSCPSARLSTRAATSLRAPGHTESREDSFEGTEVGEARLQEVEAHERRGE